MPGSDWRSGAGRWIHWEGAWRGRPVGARLPARQETRASGWLLVSSAGSCLLAAWSSGGPELCGSVVIESCLSQAQEGTGVLY